MLSKTEWAAPLWIETDFADKPIGVCSRHEALVIETPAIEWRDAEVCAPFEVVLLPWSEDRTICSTAFARPLGASDLPFIALGSHKFDGPRQWQGGGTLYNDANSVQRHLRRALPALLRRRLWGRMLWLDRELNLADEQSGVLRLYLGANGQGEWFLPGLTDTKSVRAGFDWDDENRVSRLLDSDDDALLEWVYTAAEVPDSDLAFSLNWVALGSDYPARQKRIALHFRTARDSVEQLVQVLRLAVRCEPEFAQLRHICWEIDPLAVPAAAYGPLEQWKTRVEMNQIEREYLFDGNENRRLPPFARAIREWAHDWFGAQLNRELRARHRCFDNFKLALTFVIERIDEPLPTAHEQLEAFAQLRDFLAARVAPDELKALLKLE